MDQSRKILIILHQEHSTAGRVGQLLEQLGFELDIRKPRFGEPLPQDMREHAGAVVFGGPMSANDSDAYIREEIDWLAHPLKEDKPFLGLCLGAQMLTRHLGSRVYGLDNGGIEAGYYPITPLAAAHEITADASAPFPDHVYQWHSEGFDLPTGAVQLAAGTTFPVQAYRYADNAYALQFHPEVTYETIDRWSSLGTERLKAPGSRPAHEHTAGWHRHDSAVEAWIKAFLPKWIGTPV
ncbi:GMP synthase (glutamine-hydrolysing) [Pseudomonas sp. NFACC32-1]|uniref:glutamine amidotransferase n=1 Tax=Pseudomonas TaxID=286 RepID=UPI00069E9831|nr:MULTISPECIES: glutamine amidotransferase [Pseudomonas]NHN68779.1 glutamine amidotransferase [Pseudomonas fluorescens]SCX43862.1 GMP synthase (glutamine-hydrolysing) [Pseudomonas sp. NFACC32-1]SFX30064.1 GMP synthase (glutamine-hydrolysing) [Pseudomonas sp. NFACC49-2]